MGCEMSEKTPNDNSGLKALVLVNRIIAKHYRSALPDDRNRPTRER